jgi:hypothetical protein
MVYLEYELLKVNFSFVSIYYINKSVLLFTGTIQTLLSELDDKYKDLNDKFAESSKSLIKKFSQRIHLLTETAIEQTKSDNSIYFEKFAPLVSKMFSIESKEETLKLNFDNFLQQEEYESSELDEESSDICYELLLGTKENQFNKFETCSTNDDCLGYYTVNNTSKYYLTHQLLFFIISKQVKLYLKFFFFEI